MQEVARWQVQFAVMSRQGEADSVPRLPDDFVGPGPSLDHSMVHCYKTAAPGSGPCHNLRAFLMVSNRIL